MVMKTAPAAARSCTKACQRQHAIAAADDVGMHGVGQHAPLDRLLHVAELVEPVLHDRARRLQARQHRGRRAHELEMRIVVERPADRHFDQRGLLAEAEGLAELGLIAAPRAIGPIVRAHQARVVDEAMGEQEIDGVLAQVPRRRTIAARLAAGQPGDGIVGADEIGLLFLAALLRRRDMRPAVVRHLVPVPHHRLTGAGMAFDGKSRDEPGRANAGGLQQGQDAARADEAELSARERRRGRHAAGDEARLGVEVEGQADDVAGHLCLPERGHGCNRHSIVSPPPPLAFPGPA